MDDQSILHRIQHLVDEEHRLDEASDRSPDDHKRHQIRTRIERFGAGIAALHGHAAI